MSGPKCSEYSYDDSYYRQLEKTRRQEEFRRVREAQQGIEQTSGALARLRKSLENACKAFPDEVINIGSSRFLVGDIG